MRPVVSCWRRRSGYSRADAQQKLTNMSAEERARYRSFQLLDTVNATLMAVAFTLALVYAFQRLFTARNPLRAMYLFPAVAWMAELVENAALYGLASAFPSELPVVSDAAGTITSVKLVCGFIVFPLTIVSLLLAAIRSKLVKARAARPS